MYNENELFPRNINNKAKLTQMSTYARECVWQ